MRYLQKFGAADRIAIKAKAGAYRDWVLQSGTLPSFDTALQKIDSKKFRHEKSMYLFEIKRAILKDPDICAIAEVFVKEEFPKVFALPLEKGKLNLLALSRIPRNQKTKMGKLARRILKALKLKANRKFHTHSIS